VADHLFQATDLLAQRRLRDPKTLGGLAEMQRLSDHKKIPEMPDLDFLAHIRRILMSIFQILDIWNDPP